MNLNSYSGILTGRYCLTLLDLFEFEQNVRNFACQSIQDIRSGEKTEGDSLIIILGMII